VLTCAGPLLAQRAASVLTSLALAAGRWPRPRNKAEEMALHLAIEDARDYLGMAEDSQDKRHHALPGHPDDYTWDECSSLLFQDHTS